MKSLKTTGPRSPDGREAPSSQTKSPKSQKKQIIQKANRKQIIVPKKYPTSLANKNYNDSKEMYTLEMQILTNYSKGKPTLLTNNILVVPEIDKKEGENLALESYPFFTYKVEYPLQKLRNIINYQELRINYPEVRYDLPAGGRRMVQTIDGYDATILSGKIVRYMGQSTLNLPGRLVRST